MTDEKKVLEGTLVPPDDEDKSVVQNDQRGFLTTGLQRVKKWGQLQESKLDTKLETEKNDLGDQLVRRSQIHLDLGVLQTKLANHPTIQEGVRAEVQADTMSQQQRVRDLTDAKDDSAMEGKIRRAEQKARLAKANANTEHWERKLDSARKPGLTREQQITSLKKKLDGMLQEYKDAKEAAGGELDEATARQFDLDIGRLMRKIRDLQDAEDADDDSPPFED